VAALLPARFSRFAIPALALLLVSAGLTSAAPNQRSSGAATQSPAARPPTLVVPEVRGQAYVFAKGILEDSGFAWRVRGVVNGFPANLVATQFPAPGTRLLDTGAPMITLRLDRNAKYAEEGVPENFSPFGGTRLLRPSDAKPAAAAKRPAAKPKAAPKPAAKRPKAAAKKPRPQARKAAKPRPQVRKAAKPRPQVRKAAKPRPQVRKAAKPRPQVKKAAKPKSKVRKAAGRPAAFSVPGAPKEPLKEIPLPRRARALGAWLTQHPRSTDANVAHWLYQHAWIVTGAKFGWWRGAEALRILIAVDNRVIENWGIGTRSRAAARAALAEVEAKSR
jgi:hypothetical protein